MFKPVVPNQYDLAVEWDEKVLDMTRDYEKHMQRMRTNKEDVVEKVKVMVNGSAMVSSIVLESVLNDLYVSVTISQIVLAHSKNPMPDIPVVVHAVTLSTTPTAAAAEDKKTATLTKKSVSSTFKIDDLTVSLT